MKKILFTIAMLLLMAVPCLAYSEDNTISAILSDGRIIKMIDGTMYEIYSYDTVTSRFWLPMTDVVITNDKIINTDDDESVDYVRQIR